MITGTWNAVWLEVSPLTIRRIRNRNRPRTAVNATAYSTIPKCRDLSEFGWIRSFVELTDEDYQGTEIA